VTQSPNPPLIQALFDGPIDILGDIHAEIDALRNLPGQLGYGTTGQHPDGRAGSSSSIAQA
jgi:hypothetical protein